MSATERLLYNLNKKSDKILRQLCCLSENGGGTITNCCVTVSIPVEVAGEGSGFYNSDTLVIPITASGTFQLCNLDLTDPTISLRIYTDLTLSINGSIYSPEEEEDHISLTGEDLGYDSWCNQSVEISQPGFLFYIAYAGNSSGTISEPEILSITNGGVLNGDNSAYLAPGIDSAVITFALPSHDNLSVEDLYLSVNQRLSLIDSYEDGPDLIITAIISPEYEEDTLYLGDVVTVRLEQSLPTDEVYVNFGAYGAANVTPGNPRVINNPFAGVSLKIQFLDTPSSNYDVFLYKNGVLKHSVTNQSNQVITINTNVIVGSDWSFNEVVITATT